MGPSTAKSEGVGTGRIEVLYGCMFSGKTAAMLRRVEPFRPDVVQAFKHVRDDRYGLHEIVSHDGGRYPALAVSSSAQIVSATSHAAQVVAVDEGHFFDPDFPAVCLQLRRRGLVMIITALQPNSWGVPLPLVNRLIEIADLAEHLRARCARCGAPADQTQRLTPLINGRIVGGPEAFEPRCQSCWRSPPEPPVD